MSDLTPPPDEAMPDQARARIRAELLAAAQGDRRSGRRWVVPAAAAAAVVVVAGLAGWAVQSGGGGSEGAPAGASTSATSTEAATPEPGPTESGPTEPGPTDVRSIEVSKVPGAQEDHQVDVKERGCARTMRETLPGAAQVAEFPGDGAHATSVWVAGDRFTICDVADGMTTTHQPLPLTPVPGVETFRVSSMYLPADGGGFDVTRVAAGVVPGGAAAYDVRYRFPDGATVPAEVTTGSDGRTYWRVVHRSAAPEGSEAKQPPIEVTLSLSGVRHDYRLQWGLDTCAQANHGC